MIFFIFCSNDKIVDSERGSKMSLTNVYQNGSGHKRSGREGLGNESSSREGPGNESSCREVLGTESSGYEGPSSGHVSSGLGDDECEQKRVSFQVW